MIKKCLFDIDLNVAFTFTDEQSSSKCQTTAPEFEFKLTHFPYLNVEGNMNQKNSLQEKISNNDSFSIENGE